MKNSLHSDRLWATSDNRSSRRSSVKRVSFLGSAYIRHRTLVLLLSFQITTAVAGGIGDFFKDPVGSTINAAENAVKVVVTAGNDVVVATGKAVGDVAREGGNLAGNVTATVNTAVADTTTATNTALRDTRLAAEKAITDTANVIEKAGQDTWKETRRGGTNVEEAGQAIGHYVEASVKGLGQSVTEAEQRVREGKFIDAFWHLSLAPMTVQEDASAQAFLSSSLLRNAGQLAAGVYGTPYGAAAFAAWLTMKQTGNLELAIRVGVLTGASSAAFAAAGKMPSGTLLDTVKRAAVTGAIGGAAVAAAGGDENQILQGVVKAGAMVLVQDAYKDYTKHDLDTKPPSQPALCLSILQENCPHPPVYASTVEADGTYTIDMKKIPGIYQFVGTKDLSPIGESSVLMTSISKIPGMNAMAVFHDNWAIDWNMKYLTIPTIVPAIVITYIGTEAPFQEFLKETAVEVALSEPAPVNAERPDTPIAVTQKALPAAIPATSSLHPARVEPSAGTGTPAVPKARSDTVEPTTSIAVAAPSAPVRYETIQQRMDRGSAQLGSALWITLILALAWLWWTRRRTWNFGTPSVERQKTKLGSKVKKSKNP